MPYRIEELDRHVDGTWEFDDPPEYRKFFGARQYGYAVLGLEVSQLVRRLREHAALPTPPQEPGGWNRDSLLRPRLNRLRSLKCSDSYRQIRIHARRFVAELLNTAEPR
jgi:hypothetical protein